MPAGRSCSFVTGLRSDKSESISIPGNDSIVGYVGMVWFVGSDKTKPALVTNCRVRVDV